MARTNGRAESTRRAKGRRIKAKWSWSSTADFIESKSSTSQRDDVMAKKIIVTGTPAGAIRGNRKAAAANRARRIREGAGAEPVAANAPRT